jgi:hypothetical protein
VYSIVLSQYITEAFKELSFSKKKLKKESYEKASRRSWRPRVVGCQKKNKKLCRVQKKRKRRRTERRRLSVEGGKKDECTTRWL